MRPVVAIRHHAPHGLGVAAEAFDEVGIRFRYVDAWADAEWPILDDVAGIVVLGGEMNADEVDRHPFLAHERDLLRDAVRRDVPVYGICLGAQVLARALDAAVIPSPTPELGMRPVRLTRAGRDDPVLAPFEGVPRVFQWHGDTFELPRHAVLLSEGNQVRHQAFRVGRAAYGVQFHPEPTEEDIATWCRHWADALREHWDTDPEAVMAEVREHHPAQRKAARESFLAFADLLEA